MILINGGLPRSGTVLVGAILARLATGAGHTVHRLNPAERRDMPGLARRIATHPDDAVLLVHTHLCSPDVVTALAARRDVTAFWNHRDPRDCLVSLMQLHEMTLADALVAMEVYLAALDCMAPHAERLEYATITADPVALVRHLATGAGLPCPDAARIAAATSIEAHRRVMARLSPGVEGSRTVTTLRRQMVEDAATLINDRHIQSGATGRWRDELAPEDAVEATVRLAPWLARLGYDAA